MVAAVVAAAADGEVVAVAAAVVAVDADETKSMHCQQGMQIELVEQFHKHHS